MKILFSKYQGTGNDFIILDNRSGKFSDLNKHQVAFLCDRRFGIGADGLIMLEENPGFDFYMKYFNNDGNESSMCGNGGRCITAFANSIHLVTENARFVAIDGEHEAIIKSLNPCIVKLKMLDVQEIEFVKDDVFLNTGSPHYVRLTADIDQIDIVNEARKIRYNERFSGEGTNVNFVESHFPVLEVRSYERGVEDETLSCGTGVTASVLAAVAKGIIKENEGVCEVKSRGGMLKVYYERNAGGFKNVWLEGEAKYVYSGEIEI